MFDKFNGKGLFRKNTSFLLVLYQHVIIMWLDTRTWDSGPQSRFMLIFVRLLAFRKNKRFKTKLSQIY